MAFAFTFISQKEKLTICTGGELSPSLSGVVVNYIAFQPLINLLFFLFKGQSHRGLTKCDNSRISVLITRILHIYQIGWNVWLITEGQIIVSLVLFFSSDYTVTWGLCSFPSLHLEPVAACCMANAERQTITCTHIYTVNLTTLNAYLWTVGGLGQNPCRHGENIQTSLARCWTIRIFLLWDTSAKHHVTMMLKSSDPSTKSTALWNLVTIIFVTPGRSKK